MTAQLSRLLISLVIAAACALAACNDEGTRPDVPAAGDSDNQAPTADAGPDLFVTTSNRVTLTGSGSDPDGDDLGYRWTLVSEPGGAKTVITGAHTRQSHFTPAVAGAYLFELVTNDGALESAADTVTVTSRDAPRRDPATASAAAGHAPTTVWIPDNFDNGSVTDADLATGFWQANTGGSASESNGLLVLRAARGAAGQPALATRLRHDLNFFLQPLRFSLKGIGFGGNPSARRDTVFAVALTAGEEGGRATAGAVELTVHGNGRLVLSYGPGASRGHDGTTLLDRTLAGTPTDLELTLDQGSFRVVATSARGRQSFSGRHGIDRWGIHGSSALSLRAGSRPSAGVTVTLDAIEVTSLKLFDVFANDSVENSSSREGFWVPAGGGAGLLAETHAGLTVMRGGAAGVGSRITRDFNFFAQQLAFSGSLALTPPRDGAVATARFGLTATREDMRASPAGLALSMDTRRHIRLGWKAEERGPLPDATQVLVEETLSFTPTGFDLSLSKSHYTLAVHGSQGRREFSGPHLMKWYDWSRTGNASLALEAESPAGAHGDAIARWEHVSVTRQQEYYVAPTVLGPFGDGIDLETPDLDPADQPLLRWGLVDVTRPPFNADASGRIDATHALQHAMDFAREHYLVTFLPEGRYLISDTLSCAQSLIRRSTLVLLNNSEGPCHLVGSRAGERRARLVLAPGSAGFSDPGHPKPAVYLWARSYQGNPESHQPNISYNQMFVNIDIEIGHGNGGAVGIRHQGAQGSAVQEVTIDATHGFAGLDGGSGSGGSHADITVIGGQYGLHLRTSQPAATIAGITLSGQSKSAIFYGGRQTLSAVGVRIDVPAHASGPAIKVQGRSAQLGQVSLVDSVISFERAGADNQAVWTDSSIYLRNVFTRNASAVVETMDGDRVPGAAGWNLIDEYAKGIDPPPYATNIGLFQFEAPLYRNGVRASGQLLDRRAGGSAPPADIQHRHLWPADFSGWESPGAVNVRLAPYFAEGDGLADDTSAIQRAIDDNRIVFLPKGYYRISRPLVLHADTHLIGVSKTLSNLIADPDASAFADPANPQPLIRTDSNANATTVLAFVQLRPQVDAEGAYALEWRAGRGSIVRDININRLSERGYAWVPGKDPSPSRTDFPLVRVSGHGGGKWYNFHQGQADYMAPGYRHILVHGTTQPLAFYQFNPEHAQGEANAEVRNAANVSFFGVKSESNYPVLWIRDSDNVNVYGYGGNAAALAAGEAYPAGFQQFTPSLFRIERTTNLRMVNLVDEPRVQGGHPVFGLGMNPGHWYMLLEADSRSNQVATVVLDRPVLYMRAGQ